MKLDMWQILHRKYRPNRKKPIKVSLNFHFEIFFREIWFIFSEIVRWKKEQNSIFELDGHFMVIEFILLLIIKYQHHTHAHTTNVYVRHTFRCQQSKLVIYLEQTFFVISSNTNRLKQKLIKKGATLSNYNYDFTHRLIIFFRFFHSVRNIINFIFS